MSVSMNPRFSMTANEVLSVDASSSANIIHDGFNSSAITLNGTSTPPLTMVSYQVYTLTAGAATIDLTAVKGVNDVDQDATGLKVQTLIVYNPSSNAITISPGASNGYALFGSGNDIEIPPGGRMQFYFKNSTPDVASGVKEIDLAGTGTDTIQIGFGLG